MRQRPPISATDRIRLAMSRYAMQDPGLTHVRLASIPRADALESRATPDPVRAILHPSDPTQISRPASAVLIGRAIC